MTQFALTHPTMTFILGLAVILAVSPFRMWNRYMRSKNIAAHGWPPPHCDADGDLHKDKSE